jgi:uncharacterized membrane protein YphA (DoxX/SURF4 family)
MKWAVIVVRTLTGLMFLFAGVTYFVILLNPSEAPPLPDGPAGAFGGALWATGYMTVVKVLETVGGLLLLTGRAAPLGIVLLTPVAVNIALFDVLMVGQPGFGLVLTAALLFVAWGYRSYFAPLFAPARLDR